MKTRITPQIPKIKSSQGDGRLSKIKKSEKHKNLKDKTKVTNKGAKKDEQKTSTKNRESGAYRIQLASLAKSQAAEKVSPKSKEQKIHPFGRNDGSRYESEFKIERNFLPRAR